MLYRHLGNTGLKVSVLGFGTMSFGRQTDLAQAKILLSTLKEHGVNFFDNAEVYGGQGKADRIFGQAIKELGWERSEIVVTAKVMFGTDFSETLNSRGLSRKHIVEGLKAELARMQLEYADVVFCHRYDPEVPLEEVVRAMNHVIDQGLAFYWATSEWTAQQITHAWAIADKLGLVGPVADQCQYNLLERQKVERELVPCYELYGTGLTTFRPLFSGYLTGKHIGGIDKDSRFQAEGYKDLGRFLDAWSQHPAMDKIPNLKPIAERLGCTMGQLALAWILKNERVSCVLLGATKKEQIEDNIQCLDVVQHLTPEVMTELDAALGME